MSRRSTRSSLLPSEMIGAQSMPAHSLPSVAAMPVSSSLHLQSYYSHPANTRLLLGNISQGSGKGHHFIGGAVPKPPKPPEKPLMPYMRYSRTVWDGVKASNPELKLWEIGKIIGQQWRELPPMDKQQFIDEYEVEKVEHMEQLKQYHSSPAYQAYLHAKSRAEAMEAAEALADKDDAYMSVEPTDDGAEDTDLSFSVKHVAAARFQRNHRLFNDILGETNPVPSNRSVVTTSRLNVLKNQVQSLQMHQKKLEMELVNLEESHQIKKRKLVDQAQAFEDEMNRFRAMTPQDYYKEYKLKQQQNAATAEKSSAETQKEESTPSMKGGNEKENKPAQQDANPQVTENSQYNQEERATQENRNTVDSEHENSKVEEMETDADEISEVRKESVERESEAISAATEDKKADEAPAEINSADVDNSEKSEESKEDSTANEGLKSEEKETPSVGPVDENEK